MTDREGTPADFAELFGASAPEPEDIEEKLEEVAHHAQPEQPVVEEEPAGPSDEQFIEQLFRRKPGHAELVRRLHGGEGE